jgi:hypothetical protein
MPERTAWDTQTGPLRLDWKANALMAFRLPPILHLFRDNVEIEFTPAPPTALTHTSRGGTALPTNWVLPRNQGLPASRTSDRMKCREVVYTASNRLSHNRALREALDKLEHRQAMNVAARGWVREEDMRPFLLTMTASAGLVIFLTTSPANSITITAPAGIRQAADALDLTEAVHCRKNPHRHRHGHGWSRGCRVGTVSIGRPRSGVVVRDSSPTSSGVRAPSLVGRSPGNLINPSNPQDRSGSSNPRDTTQPRAINPQDMRSR